MKKFILFLLMGLPAFAGEENNKPTALQMAPVEQVAPSTAPVVAPAVETHVAPKVAPEMKARKEQVSPSTEVKAVKKAVEPRGWHPKVKIGFTLLALGVILVVLGLGFVGGLSAFIGLLFTIAGLLHTY
ncbi:MAG: hypothetical protein RLZZ132_588 [Bacteroidota bacterium]|jgi:hypothetical protein|uniref:Uncharacterized protein n=1 Tax=Aquirufa novilacunae TaxID=3139305 RepID=A0ABW8SU60_9BACT